MATRYFVSILMVILISGEVSFASPILQSSNIVDAEGEIEDKSIYQVSIMMNDWFLCSGTIYSERVIITGAYCLHKLFHGVIPEKPKHIFVLVGNHEELLNGTRIAVESIAIHPDYDNDTLHDIGMLFLQNELKFNNYIGPIRLPESNETVTYNPTAILTDMMFEKETGRKLAIIVQTEIRKIFDCKCKYLNNPKPDTIVCAHYSRKSDRSCSTISGSSLVVNNTLIGVAVSGIACYEYCSFVIFTKVSKHVNWIINTAEKWNASESYSIPPYIYCLIILLIIVILSIIGYNWLEIILLIRKRLLFMKAQEAVWSLNDLIMKNEAYENNAEEALVF